jgi:hypothetical protein
MFQPPALIVMTIVATRMYRSLVEFADLGYYTSRLLRSLLMLTRPMSHFFRHLSNLKGARGEYRTQNDLCSTNSAQPSGGDLAQGLRGLSAGERGSFMFHMAWIRLKASNRTSLSC